MAQQYYHKAQGLENLTYEENVAAMKAEVEEAAHIICDLRHGPISPPSPEKKVTVFGNGIVYVWHLS